MQKTFLFLVTATVIGFGASAFAADTSSYTNKNNGYEATRSSDYTTSNGTTHSSEDVVDQSVDSKGRLHKSRKKESVVDPQGMMNKKKAVSKTDIDEKANGGYKQTTMTKRTDADGTDYIMKTVTDVDVDDDGNVTTTATTEKTVDPKGLMNQKTSSSKTKTVNGRVVQQKKDVEQ